MSLIKDLAKIDPKQFEAVARELAGKVNYSDHDLSTKCAKHRMKYPVYDHICNKIENDGKPLLEETALHAIGMELMLRTLIVIAERNTKNKK